MVKQTQTIRRQQRIDNLSAFDNFEGLALKGLILLFFDIDSRKPLGT